MKYNFSGIYKSLGIGLACLALSGCSGKPEEAPKRESYNADSVNIEAFSNESDRYVGNFFLVDEDHDGHVDLVKRAPGSYIFIAHGYKTDKVPDTEAGAQEMTPEMQEDADRALRMANEFSFRIKKAEHESE